MQKLLQAYIIAYKFSKMNTIITWLLLLFSLILNTNATMSVVMNTSLNSPAHVYKITCAANTQVTGRVSWNDNSDLDVYVYYQGTNFLNKNNYFKAFQTGSSMVEYISFTTTSSGVYYVWVYPYSIRSNTWLSYTIDLIVASPSSSITKSANFYKNALYSNANAIILSNSQLPTSATYSINTTVPNLKLTLYGSSLSSSYTPIANKQICLPSQPSSAQWIIMLDASVSSATTLTPFDFTVSWDPDQVTCGCQNGYILDTATTLQCQADPNYNPNQNTANNTASDTSNLTKSSNSIWAIGAAIGGVALIIIIGTAIFCYRRRQTSNREDVYSKNKNSDNPNTLDHQPSLDVIDPELYSSMCPICLEGSCNTTLPCKHIYHNVCIQAWFKRNAQCPLCRNEFSKSKMKENR